MADLATGNLNLAHIKTRACDECRQLHRKCDFAEPQCGLCKQNRRVCRRKTSKKLRFKQGMQGVAFPQVLPRTTSTFPARVHFVDETAEIIQAYDSGAEPSRSVSKLCSISPVLPSSSAKVDDLSPSMFEQSFNRCWPLKDITEILLFEHFTHKLSCFFDFCDQGRHFAIEVPRRARTCQPLLDAIFAVSARHLGMIKKNFDSYIADFFYQRCLQNLIPELDKAGSNCNDDLLAATVILRLLEELNVPLAGLDYCHHSLGTRAFLCSQTAQIPSTGLHQAAAWAGVRQEIYASLNMHRPPAVKATADMLASLLPSDDCAWANRAVSHCSDVLEFCFAETRGTIERYDVLLDNNLQWDTQRPVSYDPLCFRIPEDSKSNPLWDVRLHADWHVMGWQYITLARIILIIHDPHIPRIGLSRQSSWARMNDRARSALKLLCSIAVSNSSTPAATVVACMGVKICGDLVEDRQEQRALLDVLSRAETGHGWPTKDLRSSLQEIWARRIPEEDS